MRPETKSHTVLDDIVASVRAAEQAARHRMPIKELRRRVQAQDGRARRSLYRAMERSDAVRIIAEIKRASPSKGVIRAALDPGELARRYEQGGAAALSVLTEPLFFQGSPEDLIAARAAVGLPVLRKDFLLSEYAVLESAAMGADAVLLIARLLDEEPLARLYRLAQDLGLECLVEIHDAEDWQAIQALRPPLVGINNRNLATFETDPEHALRLARSLPDDVCPVILSGIAGPADMAAACAAGLRRFLVGESLVRAEDPAALLRTMTRVMTRVMTRAGEPDDIRRSDGQEATCLAK